MIEKPVIDRSIRSRPRRFRDGFRWHNVRWGRSRLVCRCPGVECINGVPLVGQYFSAAWVIFAHSPRIDGGEPVGNAVQDQGWHVLRASICLHLHIDKIIGYDLCSLDAAYLPFWRKMKVVTDPTQDHAAASIG